MRRSGVAGADQDVVAFGDPLESPSELLAARGRLAGGGLAPLPGAREEAHGWWR